MKPLSANDLLTLAALLMGGVLIGSLVPLAWTALGFLWTIGGIAILVAYLVFQFGTSAASEVAWRQMRRGPPRTSDAGETPPSRPTPYKLPVFLAGLAAGLVFAFSQLSKLADI